MTDQERDAATPAVPNADDLKHGAYEALRLAASCLPRQEWERVTAYATLANAYATTALLAHTTR
jgi:hypothetical protein